LLDALRPRADVVVIDSPPIPEVAEAIELAVAVDAVLICVRLGNTRRDKLNQLRELFVWRGIAPVGFVVTNDSLPVRQENEYGYGYGHANQLEPMPKLTDALSRLPNAKTRNH